jgi:Leucine-rich repeat (LRR) protein
LKELDTKIVTASMTKILLLCTVVALVGTLTFLHSNDVEKNNKLETESAPNTEQVAKSESNVLDLSNHNLLQTPSYVFQRTDLVELNLSHNSLSGSLEAEIRNVQNLQILNLSHNNYTGVPAEVGQLKQLEILNLSYNNLTGLPYELGNLSNLHVLDLRGNDYSEQDLEVIKQGLSGDVEIYTD